MSAPPSGAADLLNSSGVGDAPRPAAGDAEKSGRSRSAVVGVAVFLSAALLLLPWLGKREIESRAEARIPLVALDMIRTGRIVPPYLFGEPYLNKPPLHHLMAAGAIRVFGGHDEWTVRLPSVLCGAVAIWLTWLLVARIAGIRAGVVAAAFLLLSYRFFTLARSAELEILLTASATLSYLGLARVLWAVPAKPADAGGGASFGWWIAGAGAAVASLAKGPLIALLFPFALLVADATVKRTIRRLVSFGPLILLLGAAVGCAIYYGPVAIELGGVSALWKRLTLENVLHPKVFHYYLWQLPLGLLPAGIALPWMLRALWRTAAPVPRTCALAVAIGVLVFSSSPSKQSHYLLPLYPLVAIWAGAALVELRLRVWTLIVASAVIGWGAGFRDALPRAWQTDGTVGWKITTYAAHARRMPLGLMGRHPVIAYYLDREDLELLESPAAAVKLIEERDGAVVIDLEKGESLPPELSGYRAMSWPDYVSPARAHTYLFLHKPR